MTIYVGNLNYKVREQDISELFEEFGPVASVNIISDKFSGRSKGFGFVEMENDDDGKNAIDALHETEFMDRVMVVNEARPREERPRNNRSFDRRR